MLRVLSVLVILFVGNFTGFAEEAWSVHGRSWGLPHGDRGSSWSGASMQGTDQQAYHSSSVFRKTMLGSCIVFLSSLERSPCCPQPVTFCLRRSTWEFGKGSGPGQVAVCGAEQVCYCRCYFWVLLLIGGLQGPSLLSFSYLNLILKLFCPKLLAIPVEWVQSSEFSFSSAICWQRLRSIPCLGLFLQGALPVARGFKAALTHPRKLSQGIWGIVWGALLPPTAPPHPVRHTARQPMIAYSLASQLVCS